MVSANEKKVVFILLPIFLLVIIFLMVYLWWLRSPNPLGQVALMDCGLVGGSSTGQVVVDDKRTEELLGVFEKYKDNRRGKFGVDEMLSKKGCFGLDFYGSNNLYDEKIRSVVYYDRKGNIKVINLGRGWLVETKEFASNLKPNEN